MAVLTAKGISSLAVALLTRSLVLPMTVARIPGGEFAGANGDTITVRVRQPRAAKKQALPGDPITIDSINETPVDVTLAHLYDAVNLTDQDLSLNIEDFGVQVTEPQVAAIATGAEDELAAAMNAVANDQVSVTDVDLELRNAREELTTADVPAGDRTVAVGPGMLSSILTLDKFVRADATGDSTALRQANAGRIYGMQVIESNAIDTNDAIAYHRSSFAFANRTPVVPRGATSSATATSGGVGMRHIFQYQPANLQDQSVLTTFAGAALVDANRVYKFTTAAS